jgi:iron complex outermembrane receptor protein
VIAIIDSGERDIVLDSANRIPYLAAATSCGLLLAACLTAPLRAAEIEEVVVTAEKRESTLQDTPIAITAVTREDIQVRGLTDFSEVQFAVPALVFSEIADMAQITMRGVGVDISTMDAEPGVAVYNDGVYRGGLTSSSSLMFDLERIEVLRGPQGTLYGRNSTGGSLNVISRLPGEVPAFDAAFLYGDYDRTRVELSGDVPVVPGRLAIRGAVAYDQHDGYADNAFTGREEDDAESTFAKVAAVITASDSVDITLRGEYTDSRIGGPPFILTDDHPVPPLLLSTGNPGGILGIPGTLCGPVTCADALGLSLSPPGVGSDDPRNLYSDGTTEFERESFGLSATIDWAIGEDLALRSITSYFDIDHVGDQSNNDGVDIPYLTDNFQSGPRKRAPR